MIIKIKKILFMLMGLALFIGQNICAMQSADEKSFFKAAREGDCTTIRALNVKGISPEIKDNDSLTPLMHASYFGQAAAVVTLCDEYGAAVDATDSPTQDNYGHRTALSYAAAKGNCAIIRNLCARGANIHHIECPIHWQKENCLTEYHDPNESFEARTARAIDEYTNRPSDFEEHWYNSDMIEYTTTALSQAAFHRHPEAVRTLCELGAASHAQQLLRDLYDWKSRWSIEAMPQDYKEVCRILNPYGSWTEKFKTWSCEHTIASGMLKLATVGTIAATAVYLFKKFRL